MRTSCALLLMAFLWMGVATGCIFGFKIYPPIAYLERTAPIYPEERPQDCSLKILTSPPEQPYDVFAQVVSYAGSIEMAERMEKLIKRNACEAGADAIVLLPMQQGTHYNTETVYPDWVVGKGEGLEGRFPHWVDKRYTVSQRAFALVFKREQTAEQKKPES